MSQESLSTSNLQALVLLQRQYFALYPPYLLTLPDNRLLASPLGQEFIIQQFLGGREGEDGGVSWIRDFQPEQGYQAKFWRRVVAAIENGVAIGGHQQGDEWAVDDDIYDHVSNLMVSSSTGFQVPRPSYRTFIYDLPAKTQPHAECTEDKNGGRITLLEEQIVIQSGTTGLRTWTAALHLGHHLIQNLSTLLPPLFASNTGFIEIGAGTGLISILLSHLGFPVIATDLGDNEQDLESESSFRTPLGRLHTNLSLNSYNNEPPEIHHLDWFDARKEPSDPSYDHKWADLVQARRNVIAADVIYDPDLVPPLVDSIDVLLGSAKDQLCAVVAATVRNETTFESFLAQCAQYHLTVKDIELPPIPDANPTFWDSALDAGTRVAIMRITKETR